MDGFFSMENPINPWMIWDFGGTTNPLFLETPIYVWNNYLHDIIISSSDGFLCEPNWVFPKIKVPKKMDVFFSMENPINPWMIWDFGGTTNPLFLETPIYVWNNYLHDIIISSSDGFLCEPNWVFPKIKVPKKMDGFFSMENPINPWMIWDFGGTTNPLFLETPIYVWNNYLHDIIISSSDGFLCEPNCVFPKIKVPKKMDGFFSNGKPYEQMDDFGILGGTTNPLFVGNTQTKAPFPRAKNWLCF